MKRWLLVATTLVVVTLGISATASGTVRALITGRDIKDGSITSADVANKSLQLQDFSPGATSSLTGPAGPAGAQGEPGAKGDKGDTGITGPRGLQGSPGSTGATGPMGLTGLMGLMGPIGPSGLMGATGAIGPEGPMGASGAAGAAGAAGATGAAGADGAQGPAGPAGPQGPKGDTGAQGPRGDTGSAGHDGADGHAGKDGADGANGSAGADGAAGATGLQGPAGPQGPQGPQGPEGPAGKDGGVYFPALVDVNPLPMANHENGWGRIIMNGNSVNGGYRTTCCDDPAATGQSLEWLIPLGAGDWRMQVLYATDMDAGIMTFSIDGNDIGTVDGFASYDPNQASVVGPFHVASSGTHTLKVRIDSKNDASGGTFGYLSWIRLVSG
jgi:hypothetical protein